MRKNEEDQGAKLVRYMLSVLLGGAVALAVCFLFLLCMSVGVAQGWVSEALLYQVAIVACVIGAFIGAVVAIRRCHTRALIVGLMVGVVFFLLLLTVGVIFFESMTPEAGGIGLLCGALCGGAAAGILGGAPKGKKKRRK